eukprot:CAMPEP_0177388612 /NCGR_PEP_ID=MMETSP0368-20130122/52066_1 /TAXON_ID=447022 ORGANISM="Scrippsiella hangoei-like, Strain SHHI-4" /NCGR_SAMPLE_ID=MMETSP0368 /ASSEMBLY_ACC=CAM_ASM_000363 /LENGTH=75 /DNA_ID=CAMNT_0018853851 /DNA_START=202 /DNA_END=425 /DNA_ORIENTATION=-
MMLKTRVQRFLDSLRRFAVREFAEINIGRHAASRGTHLASRGDLTQLPSHEIVAVCSRLLHQLQRKPLAALDRLR